MDKITIRLRKEDEVLRKHFEKIKKGDHSYEARRLMELGLEKEREEKELLKKLKEKKLDS